MAELYFKVHSDWEEVVKLRNEITRLETQLNQFNGKAPLETLDKLCNELSAAKTRLTELVEAAAVEGAKLDGAFKKSITIDVSTPMGQLKAFDDELVKMSSNLNAYFDTLKGKLQDFVSILGDGKTIADNIKVNEENIAKIDELNRINAELKEQIQQIQQELDRQQAAWQQMQQAVAGNKQAVDSLTQSQQQQLQVSAEAAAKMNAALDDEVRKNDAAKKSWEDKKAEIESLQTELQKYQAAYDRVMQLKPEDGRLKRWWRETQFASAANNGEVDDATIQHVVGLNSKIEELKQRLKDAQKEEKALSDQFNSSSRRVDELRESVNSTLSPLRQMQQAEDAASKALRLDEARGMLRGITQEMNEAIDKMRTLEGDAERYRDYISKLESGDTSVLNSGQDAATELANARAELEKCESELEKQKQDYNELAKLQENYKQQIVDASGHQARMRTRIMQAREELMQMIANGKAGTPEFQKLAEEAGAMRRQMALANATMQYFANPTRHLAALKTGLQGVAGAASLATGVMGVFNTNSEKMAEIQTKIQSYLGIIVGLESTYATVKKTSNLMQAVGEVQAWAMAKAKAAEVAATEAGVIATGKATVAQALFNTVAKMNPYLLLATGIGAAVVAIYSLVKAFGSETEAAITAEEAIKKHNESMKDSDRELTIQVDNMLTSYRILQVAWRNLGNDMDSRNKFIENNQRAFEDLGLTIKSVGDAEVYLRKENENCVDAIVGKAQELIAQNKRWRDSVASTASSQMVEYAKLQRKWNELGNDMKAKQKFVEDNKTAFHDLGFAVGSVTDAENVLVQNTEAVVASIMARAKAAAYYDRMKEMMANSIVEQEKIDADQKRRQTDANNIGRRISSTEAYRLMNANKLSRGGYDYEEGADGKKNYQARYEWGDVYPSSNPNSSDFYLTEEGLKKYQQIRRQEIDAHAEDAKKKINDQLNEQLSYLQDGLTRVAEENKKKLAEIGVQEWKGGNGGSGSKGKTPDDIAKELMLREQEAARQRRENQMLEEQANIDQMDDGIEKEIRQLQLNHAKRMAELDNEQQELLNKKREQASVTARGTQRTGFYSTGQYKNVQLTGDEMLGVNSKRISENEAYADNVVALFKKIETASETSEERMKRLRIAYSGFIDEINSLTAKMNVPTFIPEGELKRIQEAERAYLESMGKGDIMAALQESFGNGNVDVLARPIIDAAELVKKGWEDAGEGIATVFSSQMGIMDAAGKETEILVTPILPDGTVLSPKELEDYVYKQLEGANDILKADTKGIVIAVDVPVPTDDIDDVGQRLHELHEQLFDESVTPYIQNLYANAARESEIFKGVRSTVEAQFKKTQEEIRNEELRAMREYLREYGSFEQQKLAITQDYEERIKKARTEGERLKLEKERDKALSSLTFENISMGIDWSALLKGVGSMSQEMLKPILEQLQAYTKTDEFNDADIREREKVIELITELRRYVGTDQSATWQQLATAIQKFTESVAKYKEAEKNEKVAVQNVANARTKLAKGEITQADFERMQREANELGQKTAEARDEMQNLGRTLNETSEQVKGYVSPLTTALSKMTAWSGVEGFSGLQNSVSQIDQLKGTLDSILPSMGEGMAKTIGSGLSSVMGSGLSALGNGLTSVMSSGIGSIIGIVAQIPKMILQIAEIIKNVVTGILDAITTILKLEWVSDLVNSILEAVGNLIDAIFDLPENLFKMLSSIVVDGIGGLVDGVLGRVGNVLSFGLLDSKGPSSWFTNGNEEEVAETSKALTEENERLRKSIDRLNDSMNKKSGVAAIKDYEQLVAQQKKVNANLVAEVDNQMGYHSAHHSNNYYASDDLVRSWQSRLNALFREHQNDYGKDSVQQANLSEGIGAFYKMTPEQLAIVRDYASDIWQYLTEVGKYDKSEYWEAAADAAGEVQKITHSLYENLTQMSFDTLKDNFLSSLMDMSTDWDDTLDGMMDNFEEMFRKAALNFALSNVNTELQRFWEDWGERMKSGVELTEDDIAEYKRRYQQLVEQGLAERERIADITGYDETHAAKQEADKKGFAGMSQDLGSELNGRFTAVQIAGENVSAQMNVAVPVLVAIGATSARTADLVDGIGQVADDMLTNIVECYTELNLIRINTDDMYKIMKENKGTLEKIEKNTKSL